jgi:hypothetical protein
MDMTVLVYGVPMASGSRLALSSREHLKLLRRFYAPADRSGDHGVIVRISVLSW